MAARDQPRHPGPVARFALALLITISVLTAPPAYAAVDGLVTTDFAGSDAGTAMAIQRGGRIVVVGRTRNTAGHSDFAVARYNVDGSLDTSFG